MPETSIVIKATDSYSSAVKKMTDTTKAFTKDVESAEKGLTLLSKNKATLKVDADRARSELREAEKQFKATGDAADGLKLELAQANYDNIVRNMKTVTSAAREMEKSISRAENQAETGGGGSSSTGMGLVQAVAASGIGDMAKSLTSSMATTFAESSLGSAGGTIFSNALSSLISGATAGAMLGGPVGAALGGIGGAALGAATGLLQNSTEKDSAFKSYVQSAVEEQLEEMDTMASSGSAIASQREQDLRALTSLLGGDADEAAMFQRSLIEVGRTPPFSYDTAMELSRSMLGLGLDTEEASKRINSLGNAAAALNLSESGVSSIVSYLESAQLAGKMDTRVLKTLSKSGINAYEALGDYFGMSTEDVASKLDEMDVEQAVQAIYDYMETHFLGAAEALTQTFEGASGRLASYEEDMQNAMGEGFNAERLKGIAQQTEWLEGSESLQDAYSAIGAWKASLENAKEKYIRDAIDEAMGSEEYREAEAAGDAAEMGRILMQAKIKGMSEYNANEGKDEALAQELSLIESVRSDTALNSDYYDAGYTLGQAFSKGRAAAMADLQSAEAATRSAALTLAEREADYYRSAGGAGRTVTGLGQGSPLTAASSAAAGAYYASTHGYASGLDYVPYDNFPALLHQGERVLTAEEARSDRRGSGGVQIVVNGLRVREEADVDRIASALLEKLELAETRG